MKKVFFYLIILISVILFSKTDAGISLIDYIDLGTYKVSWYGPGFHGRYTANGEIYNMYDYTAAHKTLKFGTFLRVTNPENEKSIIVRINDRGPFIRGRELDLSKAAALTLDIVSLGMAKLKIEQLVFNMEDFPIVVPQ